MKPPKMFLKHLKCVANIFDGRQLSIFTVIKEMIISEL
jgi:hypothetical protein